MVFGKERFNAMSSGLFFWLKESINYSINIMSSVQWTISDGFVTDKLKEFVLEMICH